MGKKQYIAPSIERVEELFELLPGGVLKRRITTSSRARAGELAGTAREDGYLRVTVDNKRVLVHRVVFALHHGRWPTDDLDHRDGNTSNTDPDNLREATHAQNQKNRSNRNKNNSSGVPGVVWDKARSLWAVQVHTNGKNHHFGRWENLELAGLIAQEARRKLFGEFAPNN